ncbi:hypothetical protein LNQ82_08615 [Conchiformibius steedae DSM 2580]|uniref:Uncharacterized protein n=1 Tax=Conchiformibius steedae DSM 2580 TaxID=1121352 RepID=A0AAE9KYY0_9NEIS|nr:hypothetical protein [Conchiformibius steedae]QMT34456.1 hypothetical protein H3L98_05715 [Conchiformibius steedae]URD67238.1 hypothetical protein LNQ82_08615 [Conchiformibius steedae DSM 2580]
MGLWKVATSFIDLVKVLANNYEDNEGKQVNPQQRRKEAYEKWKAEMLETRAELEVVYAKKQAEYRAKYEQHLASLDDGELAQMANDSSNKLRQEVARDMLKRRRSMF